MPRVLSQTERDAKLRRICDEEGFASIGDLFQAVALDSVSPSICISVDCNSVAEMEPDQHRGWCEVCGRNTQMSALVLGGLI